MRTFFSYYVCHVFTFLAVYFANVFNFKEVVEFAGAYRKVQ